jgi:hypothetical protein
MFKFIDMIQQAWCRYLIRSWIGQSRVSKPSIGRELLDQTWRRRSTAKGESVPTDSWKARYLFISLLIQLIIQLVSDIDRIEDVQQFKMLKIEISWFQLLIDIVIDIELS